jgi:hypothetical protein
MFRFAQHDTSYLSMPGRADWNSPRGRTQQRFFFFELACVAEIEPTTVAAMKSSTKIFAVAGALVLTLASGIGAASPEQEKAFTDKYKAALEGKDTATLESFLYTKAQTPGPLSFTK